MNEKAPRPILVRRRGRQARESGYTYRYTQGATVADSSIHTPLRACVRGSLGAQKQIPSTAWSTRTLSSKSWGHVGHAVDVNSAADRENNEPSWPRVDLEQLKLSARGSRLNSPRHYPARQCNGSTLAARVPTLNPIADGRLFGLIGAAAERACLASAPPMNRVRPSRCADAGRRTAG